MKSSFSLPLGRLSDRARSLFLVALVLTVGVVGLVPSARATGYLFSDDFESGGLGAWTKAVGLVDQQADVYAGSWAARANTTGTPAYARETLPSSQNDLYLQVYFELVSHSTKLTLMRLETLPGKPLVTLGINTANKLYTTNAATAKTITSGAVTTRNAWHELQLHALVGATGRIDVYVDGVADPRLSRTATLGTTGLTSLQIGDQAKAHTFNVLFDDAAADLNFINTSPPAPPTGFAATGVFADRVDLSWNPNQEADVAGYAIYRDGVQIGTTDWAHTTFSDLSVQPDTAYRYGIETFDTSQQHSSRAGPVAVTTPPVDIKPPTVPQNVRVTDTFSNQVDLAWDPSTDNEAVDRYDIYRDGGSAPIGSVPGTSTGYLDTSVSPSTAYSYTVTAVDPSDNTSDPSTAATTTTLATNTPHVWWGVATHQEGSLTDMQVLSNLEAKIGPNFKFAIFRKYTNWDQSLPTAQQMRLWNQGIEPYTAWTTYVNGSGDLTFADVASGAYDNYIRQQADSIKASGIHMFFTFQHEPEDGQGAGDPQAGSAASYIAAFERVHDIFDQEGVTNLTWMNTLTLGAFKHANGKSPEAWSPPPQYYDYVGVDGYVRFPCVQWDGRPFLTFKQTFQEAYDFAQGLGKPLFIGEVGIIEQDSCGYAGDPNAKAEWVAQGLAQMRAWPGVIAICWSHVIVNFLDQHVLDYHVDSTPQAFDAFMHGVDDRYFQRPPPT